MINEAVKSLKEKMLCSKGETLLKKAAEDFPFTYIEKERLQHDGDRLEYPLWITDENEKVIFANRSAGLLLASFRFSGRLNENEILPRDTADELLRKGASKIGDYTLIRFPLSDYGNECGLNAVTAIPENRNVEAKKDEDLLEQALYSVILPAVVLNNKKEIMFYSEKFAQLFPGKNIKKLSLPELFGDEIADVVNRFFSEGDAELEFQSALAVTAGQVNIRLARLKDNRQNFIGCLLSFTEVNENLNLILKGNMYDAIMQNGPEAIFIYDVENLRFLEVNDAALKLYGYNRNEFLKMDLTDLYAPEDIQTLIDSEGNKAEQGEYVGPWKHKKKDGSTLLVEIAKTRTDYNGKKAYLSFIKDVTGEKNREKEYQLYKSVYENTNDIIITTDSEGLVSGFNSMAVKALGYSTKELENKTLQALLTGSVREEITSKIFREKITGNNRLNASFVKKDGGTLEAEINVSPVLDYKNKPEAYNFVIKPSDETVETLQVQGKDPGTNNEIDSSFLSHLFHEILTPINVIIGFGQELIESIDEPTSEQKEAADIINENQKMLLQIMDSAAEYASLVQNEINLKPAKTTFVDIIEKVEESVKRGSRNSGAALSYGKISSSLSFRTDQQRFISLLTQFLSYCLRLSKNEKVYLSAQQYDNENFVVSVKDDLSAISEELFVKLKDIFTAEENLVRQKYGFSRFSVRLIRRLLELFEAKTGAIRKGGKPYEYGIIFPMEIKGAVEEEKAAFEPEEKSFEPLDDFMSAIGVPEPKQAPVSKPRKEVVENTAPLSGVKKPELSSSASKPEAINLKELKCMYLEDQIDSQILFKVQMKDIGKIELANGLEKALPIIENNTFDFIVMDINLQGEYNGLDALRIIKRLPGYEKVPVIAVTAYVLPGDKEKFIQAGFSDFISKPVLREDLLRTLKKLL